MAHRLESGLAAEFSSIVTERVTVPELFDDAPELSSMPRVLATAYLVALFERTCVRAMAPYLDEGEFSVGTSIELTHLAPTLVGMTITLNVKLTSVERNSLIFSLEASDQAQAVSVGTHRRQVVAAQRFDQRLEDLRRQFISSSS